ncbi:post-PEP-CTERM-1 domain-containing protein [Massilia niabensis]|uniref:Post-PEP-CTERM-1 domain-containing protein n=1 Tax=Massilia niabensis TaxID=544910 RepID=A0ABW0L443_9BURK
MSQKHQSGRLLYAAGITLALLGLAIQSAAAQEVPVQSTDSMTVVRDAETGQLRAPTAAEQAALQSQTQARASGNASAMRAAPKATQQKFHASGARGARLTDEFVSSAVAVRKPDGSIEMQCSDSHDAAKSAVATGHVHTNKVETE